MSKTEDRLRSALEDSIRAMHGYARWEGKSPVERELIAAIRVDVARAAEALGARRAVELGADEEMVTYAHRGSPKGPRFRQAKKDRLPGWAVDVKPDDAPDDAGG